MEISDLNSRPDPGEPIQACAAMIVQSQRLVVFTGAGISTDSGLPDYRGPNGVWTRRDRGLPPPPIRIPRSEIRPNTGHMGLVELQNMGKLWFLISQNVDNLHLASGIEAERLAELHGNGTLMKCLECDRRVPKEDVGWDEEKWGKGYRSSPAAPGEPRCPCGERLISSVVNFGDPMPEREMAWAFEHSRKADLFFAIGSSLAVAPANQMPLTAKRNGALLIILNRGITSLDLQADLIIRQGIGDVLPAVVDAVKDRLQ